MVFQYNLCKPHSSYGSNRDFVKYNKSEGKLLFEI